MNNPPFRLTLAAVAIGLVPPLLSAAAPAAPSDEAAAVQLSPFVVSQERDVGYVATNSLAGTRLNSEIFNTPAALSVMTREFLNDIGAIDANQAIEYGLNGGNNLSDITGNAMVWGAFSYRIRGFTGATNSRNYFRSSFLADTYNVGSFELSRGANSILFGIGSPGGTINTSTKQAQPGQELTQVALRTGSYDDFRATVDVARTLGARRHLALRLNLLYQEADGYYEFESNRRRAATLAATWRPWARTTVRVEAEHGRFHDERARPFAVGDNFGDWVAAGRPMAAAYGSVPASTTPGAGASGLFVAPQSPLGTVAAINSANFFRIASSAVPLGLSSDRYSIQDTSIVPRHANLLGPGGGNDVKFTIANATIEQRLGAGLFLEAAYNRQQRAYLNRQPGFFSDNQLSIDVNATMPVFDPATGVRTGSVANPNAGRYIARGVYNDSASDDLSEDFRLTASYELKLGKLGHHRLAALAMRTQSTSENRLRREVNRAANRRNPSFLSALNSITRLSYIDFWSPDVSLHGLLDHAKYPLRGKMMDSTFDVESGLATVSWTGGRNTLDSAILATQSSYWRDRIWVTAGVRRDRVRNVGMLATRDPVSQEFLSVALDRTNLDVSDTTGTLGLVYHVTPWFSVYANQSDNFNANGSNPLFGESGSNAIPGNVLGQGRDAGVRSRLLGGRLSFSLGFYESEQLGQRFAPSGQYGTAANTIWSALGTPRPTLVGDELRDVTSTGLEFELTANPLRNLRLTFNYSRARSFNEQRAYHYVKGYMEANRAVWLSPANASLPVVGAAQGSTVQEVWNFMARTLEIDQATNDRMPFAFRPENANFFARYQFTEGPLKDVSLGLGGNYRGPLVLGYRTVGGGTEQLTGYRQVFFNGLLGYERRNVWRRVSARFQLNVDNLLNFDDPYPRRYNWFDATQTSSQTYAYLPLRRWSFTTTFSF